MNFGSYNLDPIEGVGMKGVVKDIEMQAEADFNYTYHSWIDISDKTKFRLKASDIDFDMTLKIGIHIYIIASFFSFVSYVIAMLFCRS